MYPTSWAQPFSGQVQLHLWPVLEAGPHKPTEYPCFPFGFRPYNEHESSAVGVYVVSDPLGGC